MNNIVFNFLTELAKNNHKEWFDAHKNDYEAAKAAVNTVCEAIYNEIALHDTLSPMKIYPTKRTSVAISNANNLITAAVITSTSVLKRVL